MKQKLFTLLTLLVMCVTGAWGADHTITATRALSNSNKTCTWSAIAANNNTYFQNQTALGDGIYIVAAQNKVTLNGAQINVKADAVMYLEVPSANSAGSVTINSGNATDRYMETNSGGKLYMKEDANNPGINTLSFTSSDVVDVDGVKYLQLTSKSDNKFNGVSITLTSSDEYASLGEEEITAVKICGVAISASDLSTLKSTHSLTVAGSSVNGLPGTLEVTVANGATTVTRTISGTTANYAFTVNEIDYTVSITDVNESHSAIGSVVYYSKNDNDATGAGTSSLTANGITFSYPTKTLSYGSATVTLGLDVYKAIKLSTGEAVSVTFPTGKVATKVIVYGWSADGLTGYLSALKESENSDKAISGVGSNKFYALNKEGENYPTVYEYTLDNWESAYFQGSGSQPFVVMDFVLVDAPIATLPTKSRTGYSCSVTGSVASTSSGVTLKDQTVYSITSDNSIILTVPSTTEVSKIVVSGTSGDASSSSTVTITGANEESANATFNNRKGEIVSINFTPTTQTTSYTISSASKDSWIQIEIYGEELVLTPKKQYTTLTSAYNLDFTNVDGLNAYIVKADGVSESAVTLTQVNKVPAGTGLVLKGTPNTKYTLATYEDEGDDVSENKMVGSATAETAPVTDAAYILSNGEFHPWSGEGNIAAGKAYLNVNSAGAKALSINFSDFTGISNAEANEASKTDSDKMYNLSGQMVGEGYKGIVIVNGKKVIK